MRRRRQPSEEELEELPTVKKLKSEPLVEADVVSSKAVDNKTKEDRYKNYYDSTEEIRATRAKLLAQMKQIDDAERDWRKRIALHEATIQSPLAESIAKAWYDEIKALQSKREPFEPQPNWWKQGPKIEPKAGSCDSCDNVLPSGVASRFLYVDEDWTVTYWWRALQDKPEADNCGDTRALTCHPTLCQDCFCYALLMLRRYRDASYVLDLTPLEDDTRILTKVEAMERAEHIVPYSHTLLARESP